ncbi:MAG: kelch repeat-containing protein [Candidatus Promineifilaceae bacterium]
MKRLRAFMATALFALLVLFIFTMMGGGPEVHASSSLGEAKSGPSGVALLADNLPVSESQTGTSAIGLRGGGNWTMLTNMRQGVRQVNGGGYSGGFVYVPGGLINTGPNFQNTMQFYDIANGRWRIDNEAMPLTLTDAAICTDAGGNIHVINGFDSGMSLNSSHMVYDPSADAGSRWSTAAAPAVGGNNFYSQGSGCVVIDRYLYLFGGLGNIGAGSPAALSATWVWNPMTDSWSDTGFSMNTARYWFGYGDKSNNGYVAGGTDGSGPTPLASTERFTPGSGWQALMDLPMGLLSPGLVGTENGPMVFGGGFYNGTNYVLQTATYLCDGSCPPSASWNNTAINLNTGRWFAAYAGGPPEGPFVGGGYPVGTNGSLKTSERFQAPIITK